MEDVGLKSRGVLRATLAGSVLVSHRTKSRDSDGGRHGGPHPGGGHHAEDLAQLEVVAKRLGDGHVLVNTNVHERVDGGHEAEAVQPAVDLAEGAGGRTKHPTAFDEGRDGEGLDSGAHQKVGHSQVDEEQVGPSAHAPVADDDGQHHGVAHHRQES